MFNFGRMNRAWYWTVVGGFVAIAVLVRFLGGSSVPLMMQIIGLAAVAPRLQDLGRSAWWSLVVILGDLVSVFVGAMLFGPLAFGQIRPWYLLAVWVGIFVLGAIPGQRGENRYGPQPPAGVTIGPG